MRRWRYATERRWAWKSRSASRAASTGRSSRRESASRAFDGRGGRGRAHVGAHRDRDPLSGAGLPRVRAQVICQPHGELSRRSCELRPGNGRFLQQPPADRRSRGRPCPIGANTRCDSFSTDAARFPSQHTCGQGIFGRRLRPERALRDRPGRQQSFGFGIAGNENTMASAACRSASDFPFANATHAGRQTAATFRRSSSASSRRRPSRRQSSSFERRRASTNFCESAIADPIFGSPNRSQLKALKETGGTTCRPAIRISPACWRSRPCGSSALATLCRAYKSGLVLVHQSTFFEKTKPTRLELECGLGEPFHPSQKIQFDNHRKYNEPFYAKRKAIADALGIPLAGWGMTGDLSFMDEFHADAEGTRFMSQVIGDEIEYAAQQRNLRPEGGQEGARARSGLDQPRERARRDRRSGACPCGRRDRRAAPPRPRASSPAPSSPGPWPRRSRCSSARRRSRAPSPPPRREAVPTPASTSTGTLGALDDEPDRHPVLDAEARADRRAQAA